MESSSPISTSTNSTIDHGKINRKRLRDFNRHVSGLPAPKLLSAEDVEFGAPLPEIEEAKEEEYFRDENLKCWYCNERGHNAKGRDAMKKCYIEKNALIGLNGQKVTADKAVKNKSTGNMELIWNVVKVVDVRHNDEGEREYRLRCVNLPPKFDFWTDDYDGYGKSIADFWVAKTTRHNAGYVVTMGIEKECRREIKELRNEDASFDMNQLPFVSLLRSHFNNNPERLEPNRLLKLSRSCKRNQKNRKRNAYRANLRTSTITPKLKPQQQQPEQQQVEESPSIQLQDSIPLLKKQDQQSSSIQLQDSIPLLKKQDQQSSSIQLPHSMPLFQKQNLQSSSMPQQQQSTPEFIELDDDIDENLEKEILDLAPLCESNWLNDKIVNEYMALINERSQKNQKLPKAYAFNSFFFTRLSTKGYDSVKQWTKKLNIFSYKVLIIPLHLGAHWCLCTVDFSKKRITYYDSFHGNNENCLMLIKNYICQESLDKKKTKFDLEGWETECTKEIPRQTNSYDCGVFICRLAECCSRCERPFFDQQDTDKLRKQMAVEIERKCLYQNIVADEIKIPKNSILSMESFKRRPNPIDFSTYEFCYVCNRFHSSFRCKQDYTKIGNITEISKQEKACTNREEFKKRYIKSKNDVAIVIAQCIPIETKEKKEFTNPQGISNIRPILKTEEFQTKGLKFVINFVKECIEPLRILKTQDPFKSNLTFDIFAD